MISTFFLLKSSHVLPSNLPTNQPFRQIFIQTILLLLLLLPLPTFIQIKNLFPFFWFSLGCHWSPYLKVLTCFSLLLLLSSSLNEWWNGCLTGWLCQRTHSFYFDSSAGVDVGLLWLLRLLFFVSIHTRQSYSLAIITSSITLTHSCANWTTG